MHTKICKTCGESFDTNRAHKSYCNIKCYRNNKDIKAKYADRTKTFLNKYNATYTRRFKQLQAKCTLKKYEIDVTFDKYKELLDKGCIYCAKELAKEKGVSLDRKDSSIGYLESNVVPCCGKCNQIKNVHLTFDEMIVAMKAVKEYRGR